MEGPTNFHLSFDENEMEFVGQIGGYVDKFAAYAPQVNIGVRRQR